MPVPSGLGGRRSGSKSASPRPVPSDLGGRRSGSKSASPRPVPSGLGGRRSGSKSALPPGLGGRRSVSGSASPRPAPPGLGGRRSASTSASPRPGPSSSSSRPSRPRSKYTEPCRVPWSVASHHSTCAGPPGGCSVARSDCPGSVSTSSAGPGPTWASPWPRRKADPRGGRTASHGPTSRSRSARGGPDRAIRLPAPRSELW
jgi:hypothetical protein